MNKEQGIGDRYHEETSYSRNRMSGGDLRRSDMAEPFKTYPDAEKISLPEPPISAGKSLWDILSNRRSIRDYVDKPLSMDELSLLLWAIQGVTAKMGTYALRTAPSAGALYPVETYVLINRVDGLHPGVYHYDVLQHRLEVLKKGNFGTVVSNAALGQDMLEQAGIVFIWTGIIGRSKWKYRERAYRYIDMDAGHICQNAYLAAEAMNLGCCSVGAFLDDEVNSIVGIDDKDEIAVYLCGIGKK
jgi:SagB-type dehydrogenase family enzyme